MNIIEKLSLIINKTKEYNNFNNIETIENFYNIKNIILEIKEIHSNLSIITDKLIMKKFFETHKEDLILLEKKQDLSKDLLFKFVSALSALHQLKRIDYIDVETASEEDIFKKTIDMLPKTDLKLQTFLDTGKLDLK